MTTVASRMARDVRFVREQDPLTKAVDLITERRIRHLPVLAELERLVGIVTDRDVKLALPSSLLDQPPDWREVFDRIPVSRIMTRDPYCIHPDEAIETGISLMIQHRIGCLPVVEEGSLVGILTETDALRFCLDGMADHA